MHPFPLASICNILFIIFKFLVIEVSQLSLFQRIVCLMGSNLFVLRVCMQQEKYLVECMVPIAWQVTPCLSVPSSVVWPVAMRLLCDLLYYSRIDLQLFTKICALYILTHQPRNSDTYLCTIHYIYLPPPLPCVLVFRLVVDRCLKRIHTEIIKFLAVVVFSCGFDCHFGNPSYLPHNYNIITGFDLGVTEFS